MLKTSAILSDKIKGIGLLGGSTVATSVTPKYVGYQDEKEGGSFAARAGVTGGAAALSAAAFNPRKTLPKSIIKKIIGSGGKGVLKAVEKKAPIVGAG